MWLCCSCHDLIEKKRWMGRDLNSRSPVCETGILTKLDHPSGNRTENNANSIRNKYLSIITMHI